MPAAGTSPKVSATSADIFTLGKQGQIHFLALSLPLPILSRLVPLVPTPRSYTFFVPPSWLRRACYATSSCHPPLAHLDVRWLPATGFAMDDPSGCRLQLHQHCRDDTARQPMGTAPLDHGQ